MDVNWIEIKPEPVPKLTAEALAERGIEWPQEASCAVTCSDGCSYFLKSTVRNWFITDWSGNGNAIELIPGEWDTSDWRHSKIPRPEQWVPFSRETLPKLPFVVKSLLFENLILVVTQANDSMVWIGTANRGKSYQDFFREYAMEDGSPCGVKK